MGAADERTLGGDVRASLRGDETLASDPHTSVPGERDEQAEPIAAGTLIGDTYRVVRLIGAGAMGVVYEALDVALDRRVAVKLQLGSVQTTDETRMLREARAMARLAHPNVVNVLEVDRFNDRIYIAMEYVDGGNATAWRKGSPRTWREVLDLYAQAAAGLDAAHRLGIVHRDFKPDNVLVGLDGRARVADFGVACVHGQPDPSTTTPDDRRSEGAAHTGTGTLVGSPAYMAPEQLEGKPVDARADQFAFCVALFEGLFGTRPFQADNIAARYVAIKAGELHLPRSGRPVPRHVITALARGLAAEPESRWPDMTALVAALRDNPWPRRRLAAGLVGALGVGGWLLLRDPVAEDCRAASDPATFWNPDRAAQVTAAFHATQSTIASDAAATVAAELDAWSTAWAGQRTEVCLMERGAEGKATDTRMRADCLDRARLDVAAVVDMLGTADGEVVARAGDLMMRLPSLRRCEDPSAQQMFTDDVIPAERAAYDQRFAVVSTAAAQVEAGHPLEARATIDSVDIDGDAYPHLAGRAHLVRFRAMGTTERDEVLIAEAELALPFALHSGDAELEIAAYIAMADAVGRRSRGTAEALRWLDAAEAVAARHHASTALQNELRITRIRTKNNASQHAEAAADARALIAADVDPRTKARAELLLAETAALEFGDIEAVSAADRALANVEVVFGTEHSLYVEALSELSQAHFAARQFGPAISLLDRAIEIADRIYGPRGRATGSLHLERGHALRKLGEFPRAQAEIGLSLAIAAARGDRAGVALAVMGEAQLLDALAGDASAAAILESYRGLAESVWGRDSGPVASWYVNLSAYLLGTDRPGEALAFATEAATTIDRIEGPEHIRALYAQGNRAHALRRLERYDEALAVIDRMIAIATVARGPDSIEIAKFGVTRGAVLRSMGRVEEGISTLARATEVLERAAPEDPDNFRVLAVYADALEEAKRHDDAVATRERTIAHGERSGLPPDRIAKQRFQLAQLLWKQGRRADAKTLARQARDTLALTGDADVAAIDAWLRDPSRPVVKTD